MTSNAFGGFMCMPRGYAAAAAAGGWKERKDELRLGNELLTVVKNEKPKNLLSLSSGQNNGINNNTKMAASGIIFQGDFFPFVMVVFNWGPRKQNVSQKRTGPIDRPVNASFGGIRSKEKEIIFFSPAWPSTPIRQSEQKGRLFCPISFLILCSIREGWSFQPVSRARRRSPCKYMPCFNLLYFRPLNDLHEFFVATNEEILALTSWQKVLPDRYIHVEHFFLFLVRPWNLARRTYKFGQHALLPKRSVVAVLDLSADLLLSKSLDYKKNECNANSLLPPTVALITPHCHNQVTKMDRISDAFFFLINGDFAVLRRLVVSVFIRRNVKGWKVLTDKAA